MNKVSIIIPFYNCPYIDRAIKSALNQTYKNIEVIVVNDGSTIHAEKIKPYQKWIRFVEKSNGGTASALNAGIRQSTGDYFTWLSSDDLYDPRKIEMQLDFMEKNNAHVSYTSFYTIDVKDNVTSSPVGFYFKTNDQFARRMKKGCPINGCTVMLKTAVFSEVGLFDQSLVYTHDYDLWLRLLRKYTFHYFNAPLVFYRIHDQMSTKRYPRELKQEVRYVRNKYSK
jgi:glycosyltransferase involved in cell wall biosynthesis